MAAEVFWKLHAGLPKQGAGSDESTRRALSMIPNLGPEPRILDLGCGPGRQSLVLASETGGHVTAVDLLDPFLEEVAQRAEGAGLTNQITPLRANMIEVGANSTETFDLIWCEGAIYNVGFEVGLRSWRPWLSEGGSLVVSELCWRSDERPQQAVDFWAEGYPAMTSIEGSLAIATQTGFSVVDHFALPLRDWTVDYYDVIAERVEQLRFERGQEPEIAAALDAANLEHEVALRHHESFAYVFFILQPNEEKDDPRRR